MNTATLPDAQSTGTLAADILSRIHTDPEYPRLIDGCGRYSNEWTCTTGTLTVSGWDIDVDATPLLEEALRVIAIKAAVHELTGGDEAAAELPVAQPVDEVVHAILAQRTLTERMAARGGFAVVHMTDTEQRAGGYRPGCYTGQVYEAAFGQEPPGRYWISAVEHRRRAGILSERLAAVGIHDAGRRHGIDFGTMPEPVMM